MNFGLNAREKVLVLCGPVCSGKSTLARQMMKTLPKGQCEVLQQGWIGAGSDVEVKADVKVKIGVKVGAGVMPEVGADATLAEKAKAMSEVKKDVRAASEVEVSAASEEKVKIEAEDKLLDELFEVAKATLMAKKWLICDLDLVELEQLEAVLDTLDEVAVEVALKNLDRAGSLVDDGNANSEFIRLGVEAMRRLMKDRQTGVVLVKFFPAVESGKALLKQKYLRLRRAGESTQRIGKLHRSEMVMIEEQRRRFRDLMVKDFNQISDGMVMREVTVKDVMMVGLSYSAR